MDLQKDDYIIVEIIPTHSNPKRGMIAQISALKLKGIKLLDRFDYRLEESFIDNRDIKQMIQYDKTNFNYLDNPNKMIELFKQWIEDKPLLLIENSYTLKYLSEINNKKELVYPYLKLNHHENVFQEIQEKYHLMPSNHLVDIIYEAIIEEGNNNN